MVLMLVGFLMLVFVINFVSDTDDAMADDLSRNHQSEDESYPHLPTFEAVGDDVYSQSQTKQMSLVHGVEISEDLVELPSTHTMKNELIHPQVLSPLMSMMSAAEQDGIHLKVLSAFRSYDHQKRIWEKKWGDASNDDQNKALEVLRYSSFPGTSRHHWGTDVDFNSVSLGYWESEEGRKVHQWLLRNAPSYGFCQVYALGRDAGYSDEPWHWSHLPVAKSYYAQITKPNVLNLALSQDVKGSEAVSQMPDAMMTYIQDIRHCDVADN